MQRKQLIKRGVTLLSALVLGLISVFSLPGQQIYAANTAVAAQEAAGGEIQELGGVTVTDLYAYMYSASGAEVFLTPDPMTYFTSLPGGMVLLVTGITDNGFYRIDYEGKTYYVYSGGLSVLPDATAYRLLTYRANAAYAVDMNTGVVYYDQDSQKRLEPASTTKIMTALLTLDACAMGLISLDTPVAMSESSLTGLPSDASHVVPILKVGEIVTIRQLLQCLMLSSDCHAADRLAEVIGGTKENFAKLMNLKAQQLGCIDTNFIEPSGYPDKNHYTNAYSLALIAKAALAYPEFRTLVSTRELTIPATNMTAERKLTNTNQLIQKDSPYYNPYAFGTKTGTAGRAGACLVTYGTDGTHEILTVILGSNTRKMADGSTIKGQFFESSRLLNYAMVLAQMSGN